MKASIMTADIPRLDFPDLRQDLQAALEPRVKRLGYLGEFFKVAGHQPDALKAFVDFTESAKGGLPKRVVETIALTVAVATGNAYERNQHERLSVRLGFGRDWVAAVERLAPDAAAIGETEAVIQAFVLAALERHGRGANPMLGDVVRVLGPDGAVAVLMVIGRYVMHALLVNSLDLAPPVPSVFEDGFAG
jgi:alkylhydroperoxidase family enzyme